MPGHTGCFQFTLGLFVVLLLMDQRTTKPNNYCYLNITLLLVSYEGRKSMNHSDVNLKCLFIAIKAQLGLIIQKNVVLSARSKTEVIMILSRCLVTIVGACAGKKTPSNHSKHQITHTQKRCLEHICNTLATRHNMAWPITTLFFHKM